MPAPLTKNQVALIWKSRNLPVRTIARRVKCSTGAVSGVLNGPAPAETKPLRGKPSRVAGGVDVDDVVAAGEQLVTSGTNVELLRASLVRLERAGRVAGAEADVARVVSVERAVGQTLAKIDQLERQAVADSKPTESLDVVAAAERIRAGMRAGLDRILAELAAK